MCHHTSPGHLVHQLVVNKYNFEYFQFKSKPTFTTYYFYSTTEPQFVLLLHYNYLKTLVTNLLLVTLEVSISIRKHTLTTSTLTFGAFENSRSTSSQCDALRRIVSL